MHTVNYQHRQAAPCRVCWPLTNMEGAPTGRMYVCFIAWHPAGLSTTKSNHSCHTTTQPHATHARNTRKACPSVSIIIEYHCTWAHCSRLICLITTAQYSSPSMRHLHTLWCCAALSVSLCRPVLIGPVNLTLRKHCCSASHCPGDIHHTTALLWRRTANAEATAAVFGR